MEHAMQQDFMANLAGGFMGSVKHLENPKDLTVGFAILVTIKGNDSGEAEKIA